MLFVVSPLINENRLYDVIRSTNNKDKDSYIKTFRMSKVRLNYGQFIFKDVLFSFDLKEKESSRYYDISFKLINKKLIAQIDEESVLRIIRPFKGSRWL